MNRARVQGCRFAAFHHRAAVQNYARFAQAVDDGKIVGNQDVGKAALDAQTLRRR
jgi:predicted carbohydrate-binding protein with CBM5 and CBM33 domain